MRKYAAILLVLLLTVVPASTLGDDAPPLQIPGPDDKQVEEEKPNILFILTDDTTVDEAQRMPNVRSLIAERGVSFENAFVTDPTCCPSRTSIMRGQYAHNHGVRTNVPPYGGFRRFYRRDLQRSTVATWLNDTGYETALFGKYLNGYCRTDRECGVEKTYVPPGWDEWHAWVGGFRRLEMNANGHLVDYRDDAYPDAILGRRAADFLSKPHEDPFFAFLSVQAPHDPLRSPPAFKDMFRGEQAPRPPSFNEADVSDKPPHVAGRPPLTLKERRDMDLAYRKRLRMLANVDKIIRELIAELSRSWELDNTYLFFTSDNGYHMGLHRLRMGKNLPYEEDVRVPMYVRGPGVPEGKKVSEFVLNNDLAPTFAELSRAETPGFVDGRSFVPLLKDGPQGWRNALLVKGIAKYKDRSKGSPPYHAVRTEKYFYTEYDNGAKELYDLERDPYQLENRAEKAPSDVLAALSARLDALKSCAAKGCRAAEDASPEQGP